MSSSATTASLRKTRITDFDNDDFENTTESLLLVSPNINSLSSRGGAPAPFPRTYFIAFVWLFGLTIAIIVTCFALFTLQLVSNQYRHDDVFHYINIGVWFCYTLASLPTFWMVFKRRQKQPLRARSPYLALTSAVSGYLLISVIALGIFFEHYRTLQDKVNCDALHMIVNVLYPLFIVPYFLRAYRLYICFELNKDLADLSSSLRPYRDVAPNNVTQAYLFRFLGCVVLVFSLLAIPFYFSPNFNFLPICGVQSREFFSGVWIGIHAMEASIFLYCHYKLKDVWDSYNIRYELNAAVYSTLAICVLLFSFIGQYFHKDIHTEVGLIFSARIYLFFLLSLVFPLFRTYFKASQAGGLYVKRESLASLQAVLEDEKSFIYFKDYIVGTLQEEAVNTLKFWTEAEMYKDEFAQASNDVKVDNVRNGEAGSIQSHLPEARRLYNYYVVSQRISLTNGCVETIADAFNSGHITGNAFSEAQTEVYNQLEEQYFQPFLASEQCALMIKAAELQDIITARLG